MSDAFKNGWMHEIYLIGKINFCLSEKCLDFEICMEIKNISAD